MKRCILTLAILLGAASAPCSAQGDQYIIHDARALNELYNALGGSLWADQKGWPIAEGWQSGSEPSVRPTGITAFKDTSYSIPGETGRRREMWVSYLGFRSDNSSGTMPKSIAFPHLKSCDLYLDSGIVGTFPDISGCPELERLILWGAKLTGELPAVSHPYLMDFSVSATQLSGNIPELDCPKLKYLSLSNNRFNGTMADQNLPLLEIIRFNGGNSPSEGNQLTGKFPTILAPKLVELHAHRNNFTGPVPDLQQWPLLEECDLEFNKLTGPLPATITHDKLQSLSLMGNPIGGSVPNITAPNLEYAQLAYCQFLGTIPPLALPKLTSIDLSHNKLKHPIAGLDCPVLSHLTLSYNLIEDLPTMSGMLPSLSTLVVNWNKLEFDDLERNIDLGSGLYYSDQDSTNLIREEHGDQIIYRVRVGGSKNTYYWSTYGNIDVTGQENRDSIVTTRDEDDGFLVCTVRNTLFPDLAIHTRTRPAKPTKNPIVIGNLTFLGHGTEWEASEDDPIYSASGTISVNDFLWFDGSIEIDTEAVSIAATGMFSLKNVPLPGGDTGTFVVATGTYELKILGDEGAITDFANSTLSKLPEIAGISVSLAEIKLIGGRSADGISISGAITIDGLTNGCHDDEPGPTSIEITGLAYTRSEGFSVGGLKVEDLGFQQFPKFCVKELEAEYDAEENKLTFGTAIAMPYAEVGGGIVMIGDLVDSIAWRLEATEHAVPLGNTNLGISGFFGSISGIQTEPLDVELGGVFVTMVPKDFVKFDLSGTYTAPATIGAKIDGVAIPTPGDDDVYQLQLKGATTYDFAEGLAKLEGEAHLGTTDGKDYFIDGELALDLKASSLAMKGKIAGGYQIATFGEEDADSYPYDWINARLGLPKKFTTEANFVFIRSRLLFGIAHLGPDLGDIEYSFNFNKSWADPDFLNWKSIPAPEELRGGSGEIAATRTVIVPNNATRMVVRVKGASTLPTSTLTLPNGTTVTGTDAAKRIDYTIANGTPKAFWTVLEPAAGRWTISAPTAQAADVIEIFVDALPAPFTFTHTQQNRSVTFTWEPQGYAEDSIAFFVVGTGTTADGIDLGSAALTAGTLTIAIPMNLPVCTFNIEAQGTRGMEVITDTSAASVTVQTGALTAPSMMFAQYYTGQKLLNITWTPSAADDKTVKSYVIHARNSAGNDRLLGEAYRWVGWVSVPYTRQDGDKITVRGVDANGRMGCPTEISSITTDVEELTTAMSSEIMIIPHPVDQRAEARFWNTTAGTATVTLVDLQGRVATTLYSGYIDAGPNTIGFDGTAVPSGVYTMQIRINDDVRRIALVISR